MSRDTDLRHKTAWKKKHMGGKTIKRFVVHVLPELVFCFCRHSVALVRSEKYQRWRDAEVGGTLRCIPESWGGQSLSFTSWQVHMLCWDTCPGRFPVSTPLRTPFKNRNIYFLWSLRKLKKTVSQHIVMQQSFCHCASWTLLLLLERFDLWHNLTFSQCGVSLLTFSTFLSTY